MSITAVPISILDVRAPIAARSGKGDASCLAKWWTRKYAPLAPTSSAATASSSDWFSASAADRTVDDCEADQCPNERKPIFFNCGIALHNVLERASIPLTGQRVVQEQVRSAPPGSAQLAGQPHVGKELRPLDHPEPGLPLDASREDRRDGEE